MTDAELRKRVDADAYGVAVIPTSDLRNLLERIDAVRALHQPYEFDETLCQCGAAPYPCPTKRAADGES